MGGEGQIAISLLYFCRSNRKWARYCGGGNGHLNHNGCRGREVEQGPEAENFAWEFFSGLCHHDILEACNLRSPLRLLPGGHA